MKITDFKLLIKNLPVQQHSFDIKKSNWLKKEEIVNQDTLIENIFGNEELITICRNDLLVKQNLKHMVIKTLMWGYPTKGRGNNINNLLADVNFEKLLLTLNSYHEKDISHKKFKADLKSIQGLGISTMTKFTNFLNTTIKNNSMVILDNRIIEVINSKRFTEFREFDKITYSNAPNKYLDYIEKVNQLARDMNTKPENIEMFLFTFGRNLMNNRNKTHL